MGIDLIENSEMGAFTHSRLGNKSFVDDNEFANYTFFGNILSFGKKAQNERKRVQAEVTAKFSIPEDKKSDCKWLQNQLDMAQNELSAITSGKKIGRQKRFGSINGINNAMATLRNALISNNCQAKKEQEEAEKSKAEILSSIASETKATELSTQQALQSAQGGGSGMSKTMKYALIGVGGLVVVIGLIAVLKRR
jgi:hypothetical protein